MRLAMCCHNVVWLIVALGGFHYSEVKAEGVVFNFSATINPGTCTFSLNNHQLALGSIAGAQLQPSSLQLIQPFSLIVQNCRGTDANLTPMVHVSGEGVTRSGKWLFRSSDSKAQGVGVMLVNAAMPPVYSDTEVKVGDDIPLAGKGINPRDQDVTFYAGITCGASCADLQPGKLTARILFNLAYR
ncbi:fimbrial protein [Chania multitudinisentens]|uniref:fimbrial protein n=1 Tax=Chania multitudinisentens TaxID=1639108 RepID=UPI0003E13118|nr:type 1 fimbrial protein [Chania multitudinisentens]